MVQWLAVCVVLSGVALELQKNTSKSGHAAVTAAAGEKEKKVDGDKDAKDESHETGETWLIR